MSEKCKKCGYVDRSNEWVEFTIRCKDALSLKRRLLIDCELKGIVDVTNTVLVVRVPPKHEAFMAWCKKESIVLSNQNGVVVTPKTALAA